MVDSNDPAPAQPPATSPHTSLPWRYRAALALLRCVRADPVEIPDPGEGRFPTTRQMFLWDLAPHEVAPRGDGVVLPAWDSPAWLGGLDSGQVVAALEAQRLESSRRHAAVEAVEQKASRLLTPFVALLTGTVALTAFEVGAIHDRHGLSAFLATVGAAFGAVGGVLLLVGMSRALDADTRMGRYSSSTAEQQVTEPLQALVNEVRASQAAQFVLRKKAERILYARAAISRAMVLVVISVVAGAFSILTSPEEPVEGGPVPSPPAPTSPTPGPLRPTQTGMVPSPDTATTPSPPKQSLHDPS